MSVVGGCGVKDEMGEFFAEGHISFPVTKALAFSLKSIRIRLSRMLIVLMGVASAIAFMTMLFAMAAFTADDSSEKTGEAAADAPVVKAVASDPAEVIAVFSADTVDSGAVARAFRPWWIIIALGISIAGITNAILMSVSERIKEIGTLKCLGAMSYHIVEIFLFESVLIGLIGGSLGAAAGIGLATASLAFSGAGAAGFTMPTWGMVAGTFGIGLAFSVVIALVASVIPVIAAARIQPADAMRYEV
jgi:hypothetical protein